MRKKPSKLKLAQRSVEKAVKRTNDKIDELGGYTGDLYTALNDIQAAFDAIRNVPGEKKLEYEKLKKIRNDWKQQVDNIETDYKRAAIKNTGAGAAGAGVGVAVAALGPSAAMGIATTFGVASTGTAISTLSGAAATNAALAWLGGGALVAGGGGMAAGNALLALAGPVGLAIAGITLLGSGIAFFKGKEDKERLEKIYTLISKRDEKSYDLAIVELNERIYRIKEETGELKEALQRIESFGLDYNQMSEEQQYELGAFVNLMSASTQLLVNPILGLQPKYSEADFETFLFDKADDNERRYYEYYKDAIITLANLLYKVKLNYKDKKTLWKSLRSNKDFLLSISVPKKSFDFEVIESVFSALKYQASLKKC